MNTLLIVDDDLGYRNIMRTIAEDKGWRAVTTADWHTVVEPLVKNEISLIICDYKLRGTTAVDLLEFMKEKGLSLPVIVVTASDDEFCWESALKAGATAVYGKLELHLQDVYDLLEQYARK